VPPMSSRSCRPRLQSRWTQADPLGAAAMGGVAHKPWRLKRLKPGCAEFRWTTSTAQFSDRYIVHRCPPLAIMRSKSSLRSALPCVHCKPREHAHERCRTTNLTRRRRLKWRRCTLHGNIALAAVATPQLSIARSRMAGSCRSTPLPPKTHRAYSSCSPTKTCAHEPGAWSHLRRGTNLLPLQDDQIHYAGQPIVLVVADA